MARRLRTADYPIESRHRLADAVTRAREAAGHPYRPSFAEAAGIGVRSLEAVESKKDNAQSVTEKILHAIGRALPHWTEDTPRMILEGGPIPPNDLPPSGQGVAGERQSRAEAALAKVLGVDAVGLEDILEGRRKLPGHVAEMDQQWLLTAPRSAVVAVSALVEELVGQAAGERFLLNALELRRRHSEAIDEARDIEPADEGDRFPR
ncbi:hypothetical protein ALI144C_45030 [Actinosynnema sp. ALI-1.44]|uniref:hypothetical protein n=1 Tax=Actinosynnema sp. ALI-1.44 TaxID=1933779 RepID=UPI00097C5D44|nr:hypothetical protein [Actinosynnema sp. ALI-1.44]ONI73117.1 hypothetical protein ALI144C_45030 [Actinosynnema sp. ALI-1.44]